MIVKKIVADHVYLENFGRTTYQYDKEVDIPYLAGDFKDLVPNQKDTKTFVEKATRQYINDSLMFNETIEIGSNGLYYVILQKGYKIEKLIHEPDDLNVDIFIHKNGNLIYSFYNPKRRKNIIIKGKVSKDYDNIAKRLSANLDDILFRNYFIQVALEDYTKEIKIPNFTPSIMDAKQVSIYIGVAEKTIRTWTSQKKIPFTKISQTVRYRLKDIDKWLDDRTKQAK